MNDVQYFKDVATLADAHDNAAIAVRRLEKGALIHHIHGTIALDRTVLEGHRFAIRRIARGADLLSWDFPLA